VVVELATRRHGMDAMDADGIAGPEYGRYVVRLMDVGREHR
jgi:hypothetical protein